MAIRRPKVSTSEPTSKSVVALPAGTPAWVTTELIEQTLTVWQPRYESPLSTEDAVRILVCASQLMRTLVDEGAASDSVDPSKKDKQSDRKSPRKC